MEVAVERATGVEMAAASRGVSGIAIGRGWWWHWHPSVDSTTAAVLLLRFYCVLISLPQAGSNCLPDHDSLM